MHGSSILLLFIVIFSNAVAADFKEGTIEFYESSARKKLERRLKRYAALTNEPLPKNIIFFLGDGMGSTAIAGARIYLGEKLKRNYIDIEFEFEKFDSSSIIKTSSFNKHVTDSAASATALFVGAKVDNDMLATLGGAPNDCSKWNESKISDGVAELAIRRGKSAGYVTTTSVTDATPAALYAKGIIRDVEGPSSEKLQGRPLCKGLEVSSQLIRSPASSFKVMMGGGAIHMGPGSNSSENRDIIQEWKSLGQNRTSVTTTEELLALKGDEKGVFGVFAKNHFSYYGDPDEKKEKVPRLIDMATKAVQIMENNNEEGYFLMIEGGLIDKAEHTSRMKLSFEELYEFELAIKQVRSIVNMSETLIIVTADHSHAVSLPGYMNKTDSLFNSSQVKGQNPTDSSEVPGILFAVGPNANHAEALNATVAGSANFSMPAFVFSPDGSHGGEDVPLWADGPWSWLFTGTLENTDVPYFMKYLQCNKNPEGCANRVHTKSNSERKDNNKGSSNSSLLVLLSVLLAIISTSL